MSDPIRAVHTDRAPAAIGPYSQAVVAGHLVFASGQIALDPQTGSLIEGDVVAQTHQVLRNLAAVLEAAGSSLQHAVKCTVFLKSMDDFAKVNTVYAEHFGDARPARAAVQVARLPRDVDVEIDAIAILR